MLRTLPNEIGSGEKRIPLTRFPVGLGATHSRRALILSRELFVHPEEFLAFVHHAAGAVEKIA